MLMEEIAILMTMMTMMLMLDEDEADDDEGTAMILMLRILMMVMMIIMFMSTKGSPNYHLYVLECESLPINVEKSNASRFQNHPPGAQMGGPRLPNGLPRQAWSIWGNRGRTWPRLTGREPCG